MTTRADANVIYTTEKGTVYLHVKDPWQALFLFAKTIKTPPDPEKEARYHAMMLRLNAEKHSKQLGRKK